jgi:hypothetical protein
MTYVSIIVWLMINSPEPLSFIIREKKVMFSGHLVEFQFQGHEFHVHRNVLKRLPYIDAATRHGKDVKDIGFANFHHSSTTKIVDLDWNGVDALLTWAYTSKTDILFKRKSDRVYWEKVSIIMGADELTQTLTGMEWKTQLSGAGEKLAHYWPGVGVIFQALCNKVLTLFFNFLMNLNVFTNTVTSCLNSVVACCGALICLKLVWSAATMDISNAQDMVRVVGTIGTEVFRNYMDLVTTLFDFLFRKVKQHAAFEFCKHIPSDYVNTTSIIELCNTLVQQTLQHVTNATV